MNALHQAHGNWVTGDRFWDREDELALFISRIREGAHILLVAQRRMGKTSLMKEVSRRVADDFECVFVDFQNATTPQDAIAELSLALRPHKSLWLRTREVFGNILDRVDKVGGDDIAVTLRAGLTNGNWASKGDELFTVLAATDKPVLLLMDEVPILINRIIKGDDYIITPERRSTAGEFMSWLRKNSLRHQGHVRIAISGSIGLEPVLRQANLSATINNFTPFELKPWSPETAIGCIEALSETYGMRLCGDVTAEMVRLLGCCIPHHVQMFFDHVKSYCLRKKTTGLTLAEVQQVYQGEMLSTRGHAELAHYEERLKLVLGAQRQTLALDMLTEVAITGCLGSEAINAFRDEYATEGEPTDAAQREILWLLEHDGYLTLTAGGYVFVSTLLRDWWSSRYNMFFTPVLQRKS